MRNSKPIIFLILSFTFFGCTKEIELDLDEKKSADIVVEGFITDEQKQQSIKLSKTTSYYDKGEAPPVEGADVKVIKDGNNTINFTQNSHPDSSGYYMAPSGFNGKVGSSYEIKIDHDGNSYNGDDKLESVPDIDSLHLQLDPFQFAIPGEVEDTTVNVVVHFQEKQGKGDHYMFELFHNGENLDPKPSDKGMLDDEDLNEDVILPVQGFTLGDVSIGDTLTLKMWSISKTTYDFYIVFEEQTELSGNPFAAAPPANIPTNMSEGAIGLFEAAAISTRKIVLDAQTLSNIEIPGG